MVLQVINPVRDGTFARNSVAYLGSDAEASMLEYLPHARRTRKCMVSNPSGFEIRRHELGSPNDFYGMAYDDTYIYGVGSSNGYVYRSATGNAPFTQLAGPYTSPTARTMCAVRKADGSYRLLLFTNNVGTTPAECYYSDDRGETFSPCVIKDAGGSGSDKYLLTASCTVIYWGIRQAGPNGTVILAEWNSGGGARYVYRSTDYGVTFQVVYDAGESQITHFHAVGYHEALQRWVISSGDGQTLPKCQHMVVSNDDGATFQEFIAAGEIDQQPTYFMDYGDPTKILFGSDRYWRVATLDLQTKEIRVLLKTWPQAPSTRAFCFHVFRHAGIYYAVNDDNTASGQHGSLWVSKDLSQWSCYYTNPTTLAKIGQYLGYFGGRLHFSGANTAGNYVHSVCMPVKRMTQREGVLIEPGSDNRLTAAVSNGDDATGWTIAPYAGGTLTPDTTVRHGGSKSLRHYKNVTAGSPRCDTPAVATVNGTWYSGRFRVRGKYIEEGGRTAAQQIRYLIAIWVMSGASPAPTYRYIHVDDEWHEVVMEPIQGNGNDLKIQIVASRQSTSIPVQLWYDSVQIGPCDPSTWHPGYVSSPGDSNRANESLSIPIEMASSWSLVIPFLATDNVWITGYGSTTPKTILRLMTPAAEEIHVYFDPADRKVKLDINASGSPILSSTTFWHREGLVHVGVRMDESGNTKFSLRSNADVEHVAATMAGTPGAGSGSLVLGGAGTYDALSLTILRSLLFDEALSDSDMEAAMDATISAGQKAEDWSSFGAAPNAYGRNSLVI